MKPFRGLDILRLALMLALVHSDMKATQEKDESRSLARLEKEWVATFNSANASILENVLADDFIYTNEGGTLGKREFVMRAEIFDLSKRRIELSDGRVRVYGTAAISTGTATLWPHAGDQIKGYSKVGSGSSVINLGELSRQQQLPPSSVKPRGVPAPMTVPQDRPVPRANSQYRYTAVYVKLRGRWQMVALHLSLATRE